MRRLHQTRQAALGVRTRSSTTEDATKQEVSIRRQLIRRFHEAMREEEYHAVGTGLERSARTRAPAPGGRGGQIDGMDETGLSAGNSANAAASAATVAKQVCNITHPILIGQLTYFLCRQLPVEKTPSPRPVYLILQRPSMHE